ncbi:MAG: radical SAM protein [Acidobacteriota bacterium]
MRYIFGPVSSRRLGFSLGIDIVPLKTCSFDCIYCECGKTTEKTIEIKEWAPVEEIIKELKEALKNNKEIDHITITGSGEPTLHSKIEDIISKIKDTTRIPVAVLTNGSLLHLKKVREALLKADIILPSLDAVSDVTFRKINRPHKSIKVRKMINGLKKLRKEYKGKIFLEILFVKGVNDTKEEIFKLKREIKNISPDKIHLNTVIRPGTEKFSLPLSYEELLKIKEIFGEKTEVISSGIKEKKEEIYSDKIEFIKNLLKRRPLTSDDISASLGIDKEKIGKILHALLEKGEIRNYSFNDKVFFVRK